MARTAKTTKPATRGRKPGGAADPDVRTIGSAKRAPSVTAPKRGTRAAIPAPKVSKDALRAAVEKLGRANANLRAKNREANREAKAVAARIADLEQEVVRLERQLARQMNAEAGQKGSSGPRPRGRARSRDIDPGDAVPPGVAVEEPSGPDLEAETARGNLEKHLGGE